MLCSLQPFKGEARKILRRRFGFVQRARRERKEGGGKEKKEEGERDRERIDGERSSKSNHVEGRGEEEREEEGGGGGGEEERILQQSCQPSLLLFFRVGVGGRSVGRSVAVGGG